MEAQVKTMKKELFLGIELGSTRIKASLIDDKHIPVSSGDYVWKSSCENGVWTYELDEAWVGVKSAIAALDFDGEIKSAGISGMMHGYLAFDKDWKLLTPFRTWQNTMTAEAAAKLTELFGFNIPQRWSIAHLYQALLNKEEHISRVAHITTLAGYIHFMLTGENAVGIGEASGIFPVDSAELGYDKKMLAKFFSLEEVAAMPWRIEELLPRPLMAGKSAGKLSSEGAAILDGLLPVGLPFAPPEGDAGTGMTATNAVAAGTGNVSAGTSIFSMVVLDKPLSRVYEEIDMVTTPTGRPVAMVHCNNCTNDSNCWASLLRESAELFGAEPSSAELYTKLYEKSLEGEKDCGGVLVCNYMAGEGVTHMDSGRPMVMRMPNSRLTLANFMRAQLYSTMATLKIGMDILAEENVEIISLTGHGGLFKTPRVGQSYLAAACNAPVRTMETAGEGGPYGMALLAEYMVKREEGESLEAWLDKKVFADVPSLSLAPENEDAKGFEAYMKAYRALLDVERRAIEVL